MTEDHHPIANRALNRWLTSNTASIRAINPAVWDNAVTTARYAAFFRYVRKQSPQAWHTFLSQIDFVQPAPSVVTPDVYVDPREKELVDDLLQGLERTNQQSRSPVRR